MTKWFGLVFFFCLMPYQLLWVIQWQSHPCRKPVVVLFNPQLEDKGIHKVKLVTIVEGDPKAPLSIATTPRCRGGRYSILWIAPFYP